MTHSFPQRRSSVLAGMPDLGKVLEARRRGGDRGEDRLGGGEIVEGDEADDGVEVAFGGRGEDEPHQPRQPCFAAMSANTASAGRTRPSRAAARPALIRSTCHAFVSRYCWIAWLIT